jgi:hypothetical protein
VWQIHKFTTPWVEREKVEVELKKVEVELKLSEVKLKVPAVEVKVVVEVELKQVVLNKFHFFIFK